jgi:cholesterol 7-desaturase
MARGLPFSPACLAREDLSSTALPPFPNGWFAIAFSTEVKRGVVLSRRFLGHELVLFRTASGVAVVLDAHCPHLGAHLGDGRIEGEADSLPVHGFCFAAAGACVKTG